MLFVYFSIVLMLFHFSSHAPGRYSNGKLARICSSHGRGVQEFVVCLSYYFVIR